MPVSQLSGLSKPSAGTTNPYLATGRLGEPESPFVHQRVLDGEVLGVMEDGNIAVRLLVGGHTGGGVLVVDRRGSVFDSSHYDRR